MLCMFLHTHTYMRVQPCFMHGPPVCSQLVAEDATRRRALDADKEAAQLAVQGAVRDVERAVEERQALAAKLHAMQGALDEETASRKRLKKQLQRDAEAAKSTVAELNTRLATFGK